MWEQPRRLKTLLGLHGLLQGQLYLYLFSTFINISVAFAEHNANHTDQFTAFSFHSTLRPRNLNPVPVCASGHRRIMLVASEKGLEVISLCGHDGWTHGQ
jgi:hypothetical protein